MNPDLVVRDKEGKPYSVRYDQVNAMLLNEFLKEHKKVQDLESRMAQQEHQIECLSAGLEKVNAQLEMSRTAPGGGEWSVTIAVREEWRRPTREATLERAATEKREGSRF